MVDTRSAIIVGSAKGEEAVVGVCGREGSLQSRGGSHSIEGVLPLVGSNRCIVIEDDGGVHHNGVAGGAACLGFNEEADVTFTTPQRIVDWQEAHLRTGGLKTRGWVNALEYPCDTVVLIVDTCRDIHPNAQVAANVKPLGVGGAVGGHREDMVAEAEVGEADACDVLSVRYRIDNRYARGRCRCKVGVVLEADGVIHLLGGGHIAYILVVAFGALNLVGILRALETLQVEFFRAICHPAFGIDDATDNAVAAGTCDRVETVGPTVGVGGCATRSGSIALNRRSAADICVADTADTDAETFAGVNLVDVDVVLVHIHVGVGSLHHADTVSTRCQACSCAVGVDQHSADRRPTEAIVGSGQFYREFDRGNAVVSNDAALSLSGNSRYFSVTHCGCRGLDGFGDFVARDAECQVVGRIYIYIDITGNTWADHSDHIVRYLQRYIQQGVIV